MGRQADTDADPVHMLDDTPSTSEERVTAGANQLSKMLVLLLSALTISGLAWTLVVDTSPKDEAAPASVNEQRTTSTTPTTASGSTTSTPVAPEFLLGRSSNLWLFYGGEDQLQRLNLDSGEVDTYGLRATPLAATGGELVVATGTSFVGWLDLDDPGEQIQGRRNVHPARGDDPGHLWLLGTAPAAWVLIDISTNQVIQRREHPNQAAVPSQTGTPSRLLPGPDLLSTPNGIYQHHDGSYTRVGTGQLFDYDTNQALIKTCGATLEDCQLRWIDRVNWTPSDLPLPDDAIQSAELLADSRWLHTTGTDNASQLLSLEEDHPIGLYHLEPSAPFSVSPDGRWLATIDEEGILIINLDTGRTLDSLQIFDQPLGGSLLFVEQP